MPYRVVVSGEMAKLFGVLSNPIRIRIIEELQNKDLTVGALKEILGITHAAVSQQLSVLRSHHLVIEKRQGRNVFYHLRNPAMAKWIVDGLVFIMPDTQEAEQIWSAIQNVQAVWGKDSKEKNLIAENQSDV